MSQACEFPLRSFRAEKQLWKGRRRWELSLYHYMAFILVGDVALHVSGQGVAAFDAKLVLRRIDSLAQRALSAKRYTAGIAKFMGRQIFTAAVRTEHRWN